MKLLHRRHNYTVACRFNLVECIFNSVVGFFRLSKLTDAVHQVFLVVDI